MSKITRRYLVRCLWWLALCVAGCVEGPALVPPPDFSAVTCSTAPICSLDMGRDLSAALDIRYELDLSSKDKGDSDGQDHD